MLYRDIPAGGVVEPTNNFGSEHPRSATQIELVFFRKMTRLASIKIDGIDTRDGSAPESIRDLLGSFVSHISKERRESLPLTAEATLRLVYDMAPELIDDLRARKPASK